MADLKVRISTVLIVPIPPVECVVEGKECERRFVCCRPTLSKGENACRLDFALAISSIIRSRHVQ